LERAGEGEEALRLVAGLRDALRALELQLAAETYAQLKQVLWMRLKLSDKIFIASAIVPARGGITVIPLKQEEFEELIRDKEVVYVGKSYSPRHNQALILKHGDEVYIVHYFIFPSDA
jgi:hypothetical protein